MANVLHPDASRKPRSCDIARPYGPMVAKVRFAPLELANLESG